MLVLLRKNLSPNLVQDLHRLHDHDLAHLHRLLRVIFSRLDKLISQANHQITFSDVTLLKIALLQHVSKLHEALETDHLLLILHELAHLFQQEHLVVLHWLCKLYWVAQNYFLFFTGVVAFVPQQIVSCHLCASYLKLAPLGTFSNNQ